VELWINKGIVLFLACMAVPALAADSAPVGLQPVAEQVRRVTAVLQLLGQPLSQEDQAQANSALAQTDSATAIQSVEKVLDKYVLIVVGINPEGQLTLSRGGAKPALVQASAHAFLVQINNNGGLTSALTVDSPNNGVVYVPSSGKPEPEQKLTNADVRERWAEISLFSQPPMADRLSGAPLEYAILIVAGRDQGLHTARISFSVGQGGPGPAGALGEPIVFNVLAAHSVKLHVLDSDGQPTTASFIFQDAFGRIYPSQPKRLAPDFYFQPQVYRGDGESIELPPGFYTVTYTGGPEYLTETRHFQVAGGQPQTLTFQLKRWIDPAQYGWFSGDDHIHPAGCSHYENPTMGVTPDDMGRQVKGEHLNLAEVLVWGPCFYYQKQFFQGRQNDRSSTPNSLLHYDLEVSGFPSSGSGHLVLLDLKDILYPGTKRIEEWPTWDLPELRWAKSQGATVGFAHSGWGLEVKTSALPNYDIPPFDGIGANEYIVDVTYPGTVDFISEGDTPYVWELNIWYQTLNVGFRTRISGETDFPCIYDSRVGEGRTYAKVSRPLTYANYVKAVQDGSAYVSDGRSHLMDFAVNGVEVGTSKSQVDLSAPGTVQLSLTAAAMLPEQPNKAIDELPYNQRPYWHLERARIGQTRNVPVEIIVNGEVVSRREIVADGSLQKLQFSVPVSKSSWIAARILPSSHTDPIFVLVGGKPIRASRKSAEWCLKSVNQAWTQKAPHISGRELPEAQKAYDHARQTYTQLINESSE
jgi:hypothetical protein